MIGDSLPEDEFNRILNSMGRPKVDRDTQDQQNATRIYADFKWWTKRCDRTVPEMIERLEGCKRACEHQIVSPAIRGAVVLQFERMINRLSEFNVPEDDDQDPPLEPAA